MSEDAMIFCLISVGIVMIIVLLFIMSCMRLSSKIKEEEKSIDLENEK